MSLKSNSSMKLINFFKDRISWFKEPKILRFGDVLISVVAALLFFLCGPDDLFVGSALDWRFYLIIFPASLIFGVVSAFRFQSMDLDGLDPSFIRGCWGLVGGIVSVPVCLVFRKSAISYSIALFLIGAGEVCGYAIFKILKSKLN